MCVHFMINRNKNGKCLWWSPKVHLTYFLLQYYQAITFANVRFWFSHRYNWSICFSSRITVVKTGGDVLMNWVSTVLAFLAGVGTLVEDRHGSPYLCFSGSDLLILGLGILCPRGFMVASPSTVVFFWKFGYTKYPPQRKCQSLTQGVKMCIPENFCGKVSIHFRHLSKLSFFSASMGYSKTLLLSSLDEVVWMVSSEFPLITSDFCPEELPLV